MMKGASVILKVDGLLKGTLKLDSEMVFMKLRQKAMPRRSCKIQIHLQGHKKLVF